MPTDADWPAACELWRRVFFKDSPSYDEAIRPWTMALYDDARQNTLTMFHDGEPVSQVRRLERDMLVSGHRLRVGFVGAVCTHPDHRGLGLASTTLAATLERFRQDDVDFVYITGTRPLYFGAGANHAAIEYRFDLKAEAPAGLGPDVQLRPATMADIGALVSLAASEGTRVIRPWDDISMTVETGFCSGRSATFRLIELHGAPVGYLLQRVERGAVARVVEVAGDRLGALSALRLAAQELEEGATLGLVLPRGDRLVALLAAAGIEGALVRSGGTIKAIDPVRTLTKLAPCFRERVPAGCGADLQVVAGQGRYVLRNGQGQLEMDGEDEMLWALLGRPPEAEPGHVRVTGQMTEWAACCLPIPMPSLYLNMI